ncbi:MAG: Lrp/AsnC ligand binding domain-containing protein [Candidatus Hodarchaeales archaeon]
MVSINFSGRKASFISVCTLSGFFTSLYVLTDSIAMTYVPNPILYGMYTIIGGLIVTVFLWLALAIPTPSKKRLGNILDADFKIKNIFLSRKMLSYISLASLFNASSMLIYLYGVLHFDPSLMLPLMQFVVIYLLLTEFIASKDLPTIVEIQSITMITLGAMIVTLTPEMDIDLMTMFLVLGPLNLLNGLSTFFQKKAKTEKFPDGSKIDAINLRLWMVIGLFTIYGLFSLPILFTTNDFQEFLQYLIVGVQWASLSMTLTFFAYSFWLKGLDTGKTYIVNALVSISVVFSVPITLVAVTFVNPLIFGSEVSLEPFLWVLKGIGSTLIFIGILSMVLAEVRGYILVKLEVGSLNEDVLNQIRSINGVQSVSSVFGEYDLLIEYRIRSIGKVVKTIIRQVAKIKGVKEVHTQVVLNEIVKY